MSKPNPSKVNERFADIAIERANDLGSVYSQCVILSYQNTGKMACGFDAKDIIAWIKINRPDVFDEKGKKK